MSRTSKGKFTIEHLYARKAFWGTELHSTGQKRNIELPAEILTTTETAPVSLIIIAENPATKFKIAIIDYIKTYSGEMDESFTWTTKDSIQLELQASSSDAQPNNPPWNDGSVFQALIVAGNSPDSPTAREDSNTDKSVFDGVVSIRVNTSSGSVYIGSGTPIGRNYILTAAHVVDLNNDGKSNSNDGITGIVVNFNYGGVYTSQISSASVVTHPDFTGFNRPSLNDDLAIIRLSSAVPNDVPIYQLYNGSLSGKTITMVGYGRSGNGTDGFTVGPSFTVKRTGSNVVNAFYGQDDRSRATANEVFRFDFDSPSGGNGPLGGTTLGNTIEATLGGGDSGGPSFVQSSNGQYVVAGVNTFSQSQLFGPQAPLFGSLAGGINVQPYESWIKLQVSDATFVA